jgi:hypothetical protein
MAIPSAPLRTTGPRMTNLRTQTFPSSTGQSIDSSTLVPTGMWQSTWKRTPPLQRSQVLPGNTSRESISLHRSSSSNSKRRCERRSMRRLLVESRETCEIRYVVIALSNQLQQPIKQGAIGVPDGLRPFPRSRMPATRCILCLSARRPATGNSTVRSGTIVFDSGAIGVDWTLKYHRHYMLHLGTRNSVHER